MADKKIDFDLIRRLDEDKREVVGRVDSINERLTGLAQTVAKLDGRLQPNTPLWAKLLLGIASTLATAAVIGGVAGYINLSTRLFAVETKLSGLSLKQAAANPTDPDSIKETEQVLISAKARKIRIDKGTVKQAGERFIRASETDVDPWHAVMVFLAYQSFLNADLAAELSRLAGPERAETRYSLVRPDTPGLTSPSFRHYGKVPLDRAVILEPIGAGLNANNEYGDAYLLGEGGAIQIDGHEMRNVILRNVHIIYRGRATKLQNVYLINCTFEVTREPEGRSFALAMLEYSPAITFAAA